MNNGRHTHRAIGAAARRVTLLALVAATLPLLAAKIVEFPLANANSQPYTICLGPDGRLWFTEIAGNRIGAMTTDGVISEYTIPTANSSPIGITAAPANIEGLVFSMSNAGALEGIFTSGSFSGLLYTGLTAPGQVTAGPDGRVWATESSISKIWAQKYATFGLATTEIPTITASAGPLGITPYSGTIAFTEDSANKIGFMTYELDGIDQEVTIPTAASHPRRLAAAGKYLYFTENGANKIGRYERGANHFDEYPIPTSASAPLGICLGPDGNVWFTEHDGNKIGRVTPAGVITEYTIPTGGSGPSSICTGPDGNLYFTENSANKIGKLDVFIPGDTNDDGTVDVADVFYTINFLFAGGPAPK
jgi:streptogramin lyase